MSIKGKSFKNICDSVALPLTGRVFCFLCHIKNKKDMDNEIYQLVKHLSRRGLDNLSYEEKRIKLWQRAVKKWNTTHEPVSLTLEEVYQAFKCRWPQIYGGEPSRDTLYLSFSYIDYCFTRNSKGQVCGGIWPRITKNPHSPVNMTAEQMVDLASLLRIVPESLSDWKKDEDIISKSCGIINEPVDPDIEDSGSNIIVQEAQYWALKDCGISKYMLGQFEESFHYLSRAHLTLMTMNANEKRTQTPEQIQNNSVHEDIKFAELLTMMADNLVYMFQWQEAEWCFQLAYEHSLCVFEKNDWHQKYYWNLPEEERSGFDQSQRCVYLDWAWRFAAFYAKSHMPSKAIPILEVAEIIAKDMNRVDEGKWSEKLESISNKLVSLKADNAEL